MRDLMIFRRDELQCEEISDDSSGPDTLKKKQKLIGIEEAGEMVKCVEDNVANFSNAIQQLDKKMSYNLRLLSTMIYNYE